MANRILIISLCYLFALCSSCSKGPEIHTKPPVEIHADEKALIANEAEIVANAPKSSNKFAFDLYKDLATEESNLVFSPFSISLALAMTYAGAKGDTAAAIKKVFYFGDNTLDFHKSFGELASLLVSKDRKALDTKLMIANGLWLQSGFNVLQPFKNTLKVAYHSQLTELDFAHEPGPSTKKINVTVSEQTAGEIDKLLKQDLKKTTQFVITNAIYFKSKWRSPFEANKTAKRRFLKNNGQSVDTDFMMQTHRFPYGENEQKQFLMMPYKDADFAAFFILPRENQLASVENGLNDVSVDALLDGLSVKNVDVWLPKFSQRIAPNIKDALIKRHLGVLFDQDHADLTGIAPRSSKQENIYVENVIHEAVVKMYEEGTTAAAATAVVGLKATAMPAKPEAVVPFHADRPFLFFILHKPSKTILFMGRVDEPKLSE